MIQKVRRKIVFGVFSKIQKKIWKFKSPISFKKSQETKYSTKKNWKKKVKKIWSAKKRQLQKKIQILNFLSPFYSTQFITIFACFYLRKSLVMVYQIPHFLTFGLCVFVLQSYPKFLVWYSSLIVFSWLIFFSGLSLNFYWFYLRISCILWPLVP